MQPNKTEERFGLISRGPLCSSTWTLTCLYVESHSSDSHAQFPISYITYIFFLFFLLFCNFIPLLHYIFLLFLFLLYYEVNILIFYTMMPSFFCWQKNNKIKYVLNPTKITFFWFYSNLSFYHFINEKKKEKKKKEGYSLSSSRSICFYILYKNIY